MHEVQKKLLSLGSIIDIGSLSYRQLCERVDCRHASQIQHHIGQLVKNGYLQRKPDGSIIVLDRRERGFVDNSTLSIPILGEADCGEATRFASDTIQGYLSVSPSTIRVKNTRKVFALIARGNSMSRAQINGKTIEDSDYVLIEKKDAYNPIDGDYVVSIINGMANIKRFQRDWKHERIVLNPESYDSSHQPIIIANEDLQYYQAAGKVVDVVKGIRHLA